MKSYQYIEVLQRRLIPDMQKALSSGEGIFQQDLAPCHCSEKMMKFLSDNNIAVLKWPGNSPDLNLIANLLAIIKKELQKYDCTTTTKLIEGTISIWYRGRNHQNM